MRRGDLARSGRLVKGSLISAVFLLLLVPVTVFAAALDDYYLAAFGALPGSAVEKAVLLTGGPTEAVRSGTPLRHGLKQDWKYLESSTQATLAKYLAKPALTGTEQVLLSAGGHFNIHYTTSGGDAPDFVTINQDTGLGLTSVADWATQIANRFEDAYTFYFGSGGQGYHPPPNFPAAPFDVYVHSLVSLGDYGLTQSDAARPNAASAAYPNACTSYIEIDKDFTNNIFMRQGFNPLQSLQVTSVHEFHHAVQYGYNYYFDIWYAEATSTWFEGQLYPGIGQNYSYIPGWFGNSTRQLDLTQSDPTFNAQGYGRWIFNRYLAEKYTPTVVRNVWEKVAGLNSPGNNQDIAMAPVLDSVLATASYGSTLSAELFAFSKRVYRRDWPSSDNVGLAQIPSYTPVGSFSSYPVSSNSVTLPHYSFAYYRFSPISGAPATLNLTVNGTSGIKATAFLTNGSGVTEYPFSGVNGASVAIPGFSSSSEAVLLVANTTNTDGQQASFSSNGSPASVQEPTGGSVYSSGSTPNSTTVTTTTPAASSGGGGGGCFIATAAYGSYLDPKVAELRSFRDRHLLSNAPGRLFVALYYRLSPPVARVIAGHEWMRAGVRGFLAPVVLSVEHPDAALLALGLLLLSLTGLSWRSSRRRHRFSKGTKFIHLA